MSFWSFFIDRMRVTWLLLFAIVAMGLFSYASLPRESEIDIQVPIGVVSTFFNGAEAEDMEELVTDILEKEITELDGIKEINSTSSRSISSITVEFEADEDLDDSIRGLRDKVQEARVDLPAGAEEPLVTEIRFSDRPILIFSLAGDYSVETLSKWAEDLSDRIELMSGVSSVDVSGDLKREFRIELDSARAQGLGLTLNEVASAVRAANIGFPIGNLEIDSYEYGIRLENRIKYVEVLQNITLDSGEGFLLLSDVAKITDGFEEQDVVSRVAIVEGDQNFVGNTVTLAVNKTTQGNIVDIVDEIQKFLDSGAEGLVPDNVEFVTTFNESDFVREDMELLGTSALQTVALILLFLFFFLGKRESLLASTVIPISFFLVFIIMNQIGMKLNGMVLFSLVMGLGLLVDTAIVIAEGLHDNIVKNGMNVREGALLAIRQYNTPLLAGTLTTLSAFAPMFLVSGIMGEYLKVIPTILIMLLTSSYFVAVLLLPALGARFLHKSAEEKRETWFDRWMHGNMKKYLHVMRDILKDEKSRRRVFGASLAAFFVALALPITGLVKLSLFPSSDFDFFDVSVELPRGAVLEDTREVAYKVGEVLANRAEVKNFSETVGVLQSSVGGRGSGNDGSHLASFVVNLVDESDRDEKSYIIVQSLQDELNKIDGADITVVNPQAGPPSGAPVEIRVTSKSLDRVNVVAEELELLLNSMEGITSVETSVDRGAGEFVIRPKRELLDLYGVQIGEIAALTQAYLDGYEVEELLLEGDEVKVRAYMDDEMKTPNDLKRMQVGASRIPLGEIAEIDLEPNISRIRHRDRDRFAFVRADLEEGFNTIEVVSDIQKEMTVIDMSGVEVSFGGEVEDVQQSLEDLFKSLIIGVMMIALILVIQFDSYAQPLIVMYIIPVALIGVFVGFFIFGVELSFMAFLGIVSLAGIVVNDAIILVDKINKNRASGMSVLEAALEGGRARMQPIFLTSLTTIFGLIPLLFTNEIWRDFSLAVIFGLLVSTVMTIVIAPILYVGIYRKHL